MSQHLELGANARVSCRAHATDAIRIKWSKVKEPSLPGHVKQDRNGSLVFVGVKKSDEGDYTCTAETKSETISETVRVDVVVAARFTVLPVDMVVMEKQHVMLVCAAEGDPKPTIIWDKDNRPVVNDSRRNQLENGSLYIEEARPADGGRYGCTVGNKGAIKREEVRWSSISE